jgi:hypothetical protein
MTYGEFKKTDQYKDASDITLRINDESEVDEMYYPEELDDVKITGVASLADKSIIVDLIVFNWDDRNESGWIPRGT